MGKGGQAVVRGVIVLWGWWVVGVVQQVVVWVLLEVLGRGCGGFSRRCACCDGKP